MDYEKIQAKMLIDSKCGSAQFIIKSDEEFRKYIQKIVQETINDKMMNEEILTTMHIKDNIGKYDIPYTKQDFTFYELTNNLKEILKARGISLEKLAELIGISRNTMSSVVANKGISAINMFKISKVLNLPIEEIFKYEEQDAIQSNFLDINKKEE